MLSSETLKIIKKFDIVMLNVTPDFVDKLCKYYSVILTS